MSPFKADNSIDAELESLLEIKGPTFDAATDTLESIRDNCATASGFSTHAAADVWAVSERTLSTAAYDAIVTAVWAATTRELTAITDSQLTAISTSVEAALINEGDGQQLVDAILQVFNANLDLPALELAAIAQAVRAELATELSRIDVSTSTRQATVQFPDNFDQLAIDGSGQVTTGNMRGTDGALTSFSGLPDVTVGGYASGQSPGDFNLSTLTSSQVNAEVVDVLTTDTFSEPNGVPSATSSLKDKITWLFTLARNKITQTESTQTLRNDTDSAAIATSTVSDDGTTTERGEWQ